MLKGLVSERNGATMVLSVKFHLDSKNDIKFGFIEHKSQFFLPMNSITNVSKTAYWVIKNYMSRNIKPTLTSH